MDQDEKSSQEIARELRELKDIASSLLARIERLEGRHAVQSTAPEPPKVKQESLVVTLPEERPEVAPENPDQSFESKVGRIWFNRIGMVAIVFGVAYFMKYAFDNNWIGVTGRVVLGLCAGFVLILLGELWHKRKYTKFSEGLIAGGASIMYLSILAAFNLYHLIKAGPAFAFMSLVTLYTGVFAIRYNSPGVLSFGTVGGFLTLFLIGSSQVNPAASMIYVFLLNAGILAVSYFKKYAKCNITALVLTMVWYYAWFFSQYRHEYLVLTAGFLSAIYILFSLLSILYNFVHKQVSTKADVSIVMFNGFFYFLAMCGVLSGEAVPHRTYGLLSLAMAIVYLLFSHAALERTNKEDRNLILSYVSLTLLFTTLAVPLVLKGNLISLGLITEAAILVWLGFKIDYKELRYSALILGGVVILKIIMFDFSDYEGTNLIVNTRFLTYLAFTAGALISAFNYRRNGDTLRVNERCIATALALIAAGALLFALTLEVVSLRLLYGQAQFSISALWGGYSFILILLGIFRKFRALRLMALGLFTLTILKVFVLDIWAVGQLWRMLSFVALGVVLVGTSFFYQKYKDQLINFVKG